MILDSLISAETMRSLYVTRYSYGEAAKVGDTIEQMIKFVHEVIGTSDDPVRIDQLRRLEWFAEAEYRPQLEQWASDFSVSLNEFAEDEVQFQVSALNDELKEQYFISSIPAADQIMGAALASSLPDSNQTLSDAMGRYHLTQYNLFMSTVRAGFGAGMTGVELATKIYGDRFVTDYRKAKGLGAITRAQAQTLASTSTSMISSRAKQEIIKDNSDIIIGVKWLSTLDSRTSRKCASLDGQEFYYRDNPNPPMPPAHYGCRSAAVVIPNGRYTIPDEGGTRASVGADGGAQVSASTDYYRWLKKQPADFIDDALGADVGMIFRNAGLTPQEFRRVSVDALYNPLTIQEMSAKSKKIRDYIDVNRR